MLSMLNQAAVEALCSATYLENYLDCMENLPDDLQRVVSQLRELDSQTNDILRDISQHQEIYLKQEDGTQKKKALIQIQRGLIKSQEIGDEKLALVGLISEFIENRTRQLEQDLENLDPGASQSHRDEIIVPKAVAAAAPTVNTSTSTATKARTASEDKSESAAAKVKRQRRQRTHTESLAKEEEKKEEDDKPKKKKKRKVKKETTKPMENLEPIDPDEPTYCLCEQVSYGEMIGCDNDSCVIEWFHFNCVGLTNKPKGKWYCPKCRGDKPTVKRPDLK